jgi:hypothetical protein
MQAIQWHCGCSQDPEYQSSKSIFFVAEIFFSGQEPNLTWVLALNFRFFDWFRKPVWPGLSNLSLSFHRRRRATFHENIPMSSSTFGKPDFGEEKQI